MSKEKMTREERDKRLAYLEDLNYWDHRVIMARGTKPNEIKARSDASDRIQQRAKEIEILQAMYDDDEEDEDDE